MEIDFQKIMSVKSDEGLQEYFLNSKKYVPESVEAAIEEMQRRGRSFSEEELLAVRSEFLLRREAAEKDEKEFWSSGNRWKKNVVEDENAPAFYSEQAIFLFSLFFTVIFGAVLSAINFSKTESREGVMEVSGFGLGFISLEAWILSIVPNSGLTLTLNICGSFALQFFWRKYIGKDTKYRVKPAWLPLVIATLVTALLVCVNIYSGEKN